MPSHVLPEKMQDPERRKYLILIIERRVNLESFLETIKKYFESDSGTND